MYRVALLGATVLPNIDSVEYRYGASVLPRTVTLESMDGWIDPKQPYSEQDATVGVYRFR